MDIDKIRKLAKIMNEEGLQKLVLNDKTGSLKLESMNTLDDNRMTRKLSEIKNENQVEENKQETHEIKASQVGVIYFTSDETESPSLKEGDYIKEGQKIGAIEAMKVFNDLVSPHNGIIEKIHVMNEDFVEYDELIITIKVVE